MHTNDSGLMLEGAISTPLNAHSKVSASMQVPALGQGKIRLQFSGNALFYGSCNVMVAPTLVLFPLIACLVNKLRKVPHEPQSEEDGSW